MQRFLRPLGLWFFMWARVSAQDAGVTSDQEEADLAADLARIQAANASTTSAATPADTSPSSPETSTGSASSRGLSNVMNPAISANGLFYAGGTSRSRDADYDTTGELGTGFTIQEIELQASAIVDPYFRADVVLAGNLDEVGFEEAYLTTLELPRITIRGGLFPAALGRHSPLHTHAFPFLTAPLPWRQLIGPEGLRDPGVSVDVLLPLPFYAEINAQAFRGDWAPFEGGVQDDPTTPADETVADKRRPEDFAYVGHLKTLFDLSDSSTLEVGGSYVGGRNGFGGVTSVVGGDVTFKWRPVEAERYRGLDWTTEYLLVNRADAPDSRTSGGAYTAVRYQFDQRWWAQARGAVMGLPAADNNPRTWRAEALIAFIPSEFSALRLQYAFEKAERGGLSIHEVFLQTIFSIGPHPSHAY